MARTPLEKMVVVPGPEVLEGIFLAAPDGAGGAVIAPPHPLYGGSMENPVVTEAAHACAKRGVASLRFNWRGVGASRGAPSGDAGDADADYGAALDHLSETLPGPVVACGYSFGALAAVRASRDPRVRRLVLVAPPPAMLATEALAAFDGPVLALTGARDTLAPADALQAALAPLPRAELVVVPGADHFFAAGLAEIGRAVAGFL